MLRVVNMRNMYKILNIFFLHKTNFFVLLLLLNLIHVTYYTGGGKAISNTVRKN